MQTGFQPDNGSSSGSSDDMMRRLLAMLRDTSFAGLPGLLSQLLGNQIPGGPGTGGGFFTPGPGFGGGGGIPGIPGFPGVPGVPGGPGGGTGGGGRGGHGQKGYEGTPDRGIEL